MTKQLKEIMHLGHLSLGGEQAGEDKLYPDPMVTSQPSAPGASCKFWSDNTLDRQSQVQAQVI